MTSCGFKQRKMRVIAINSIPYGIKQSIVDLLALLTAPVELLAENRFTVSPEISTALNISRNRWQRLNILIAIPSKETPACS